MSEKKYNINIFALPELLRGLKRYIVDMTESVFERVPILSNEPKLLHPNVGVGPTKNK